MNYGQLNKSLILSEYKKALITRRGIYDNVNETSVDKTKLAELSEVGLTRIQRALDIERVQSVRGKVVKLVDEKQHLSRIRNHQAESLDDIRSGNFKYFDKEEVARADFSLGCHTNLVSIKDPLLIIPEIADLAFHQDLIQYATSYFGAIPLLTYLKITVSFGGASNPSDTQYFHRDYGSKKILKAIIYLDPVTDTNSGPFTYVARSHIDNFMFENKGTRFLDSDVISEVGSNSIIEAVGEWGDVFLAETTGLHKGKLPTYRRIVLIVNFCLHPEIGFPWSKIKIKRDTFLNLSEYKKLLVSENVFDIV